MACLLLEKAASAMWNPVSGIPTLWHGPLNNIVGGYDNGTYGPNDALTREQMAAILYRYANYKGYDVSAQADLSSYTDAGSISDYALSAMRWANTKGLITGTTTTSLTPAGGAIRAQVATIIMRFCEEFGK